ncbi:unnamed protein product [Schistocephalus solidus]|uniref:Vps39_2 domain-containing protein n=1 Tax=Schistocephalus solidus TaxID=70667 RepID=A0A183T2P9_SCHSO|nr:unnamed protein product [Schistocephalus solidus]
MSKPSTLSYRLSPPPTFRVSAVQTPSWGSIDARLLFGSCDPHPQRSLQLCVRASLRSVVSLIVPGQHTQFVETALFKLCILLQDYVSANLTSEFSLSTTYDSWEALISSFRNVDVKDLFTFLIEHRAHHAQALLCSWQGDLSTALDIWRRLAFGELDDPSFPGPNFYLNTLVTLLLKPLFFHGDSPSLLRAASPDQLPTAGQLVGSPVHADLVWQHLGSMLTSQQLGMADQLLVQLARLTLWRDVGMTAAGPSNEPPARPSEVGRLLPSFPLSPENLLCRLLPEFPVLAECYLWHRIFDAGDKIPICIVVNEFEVVWGVVVAALHPQSVSAQASYADPLSVTLRSMLLTRFRETLLSPNELPLDRLFEKVTMSQRQNLLLEEQIILLCRLERHEDALRILLRERRDVGAALRYCDWCVLMHLRLRAAREALMWSGSRTPQRPNDLKVIRSSTSPTEPNVYGTLFNLLLDDAGKSGSRKRLLRLLNSEMPLSDSIDVFRQLPPDWTLTQLTIFLRRTLRSVLCAVSASEVDLGLYKGLFTSSLVQAEAAAPAPLVLQEDTVCAACNIRLDAYGPAKPFAWLLPEHKAVHLHCLPSDSLI